MNNSKTPLRSTSLYKNMIVALEPVEFVPCGRHAIANHPGVSCCLHLNQSQGVVRLDHSLIGSFSQVSLEDKGKESESWQLRMCKGAEEELYVCGHTVIWSRGGNVISTFTIDSPIKHATWCSFFVDGDDPHLPETPKDLEKGPKRNVEGVAIVSEGSLHVFTRDGDDYVTSLPFRVLKLWDSKYGLIFERSPHQNEGMSHSMGASTSSTMPKDNALTTIFCLQHPLREFAPVITKLQGGIRYMNRSRVSIVFCEDDLVMTFDSKHGLHTVWRTRKISSEDLNLLDNNLAQQQPTVNQVSGIPPISLSSPGMSPMRTSFRSPAASLTQHATAPGGNSSLLLGQIKTPHTSRNPSFAHLSHTPNSNRLCSPGPVSLNYQSHTFSPLRNSPHLVRSPSTPISHESLCLNDSVNETAEPLRPEICFEHVWSEGVTGTREGLNIGKATRAYLTEDVCGQKFLAYYVDNLRQLRLVKYSLSNDKSQLIFGAVTLLPARDAAPLKEIKMHAVLDNTGAIKLYTGIVKMVKMNVSGVPMSSLSLSHGLRNATPSLGTPQPASTPAHPSRPTSALGNMEEVGLLSPVPELTYSGVGDVTLSTVDEYPFASSGHASPIIGLPQVSGSNLLLELSNGPYFRAEVPPFCTTSLVETCMKGLQHILPSDKYLQMTVKWYALRHSPGAMASYQTEWAIFEACVREVIGYSTSSSNRALNMMQMEADTSVSPVVVAKKARHMDQGNSSDWENLLQTDYHKKLTSVWSQVGSSELLDNTLTESVIQKEASKFELQKTLKRRSSFDRSSDRSSGMSLHPLSAVFSVLHLIYEDQKLNVLTWKNIPVMGKFLQQLANDMGLVRYATSYATDHPPLIVQASTDEKDSALQTYKLPLSFCPELVPNLFANLQNLIRDGQCPAPFPVIPGVTDRTRHILAIFDCFFKKDDAGPSTTELSSFSKTVFKKATSIEMEEESSMQGITKDSSSSTHRALQYMVQFGITNEDLCTLPHGVAMPILMALHRCKELPDLDLPSEALRLIARTDLLLQNSREMVAWQDAPLSSWSDPKRFVWQSANLSGQNDRGHNDEEELVSTILHHEPQNNNNHPHLPDHNVNKPPKPTPVTPPDSADDNVTRLLFPNDHRMSEVRRLLQSTRPVKIDIVQQAGLSPQEFTDQKRARLLQFCNRTMALAVGRGMAMLGTEKPSPTEPFQIPTMDLTGRAAPGNTTVNLEGSNLETPNMKDWPQFHNGVAAGLRIKPQKDDSSWIYLNKPKERGGQTSDTPELSCEHAGFLLALGLSGHLDKLHTLNVHDYLSRTHEMTTIGLLLGLGASKCGTCDLTTMRLLSVHIPALLPPTSTEFDLPRLVQTAAVSAVGFLYMGSAQRLVAEVMLREIDRPPSPENDTGQDRSAYALSCGMALGAITLGRGGNIPELADLSIPDHLFHYMTGRKKRREEPSAQSIILEGDQINTEVTAPGAIMALALMFLKTNNMAVADWFVAPGTLLLLEMIKPHHLLLRTLARGLILWDYIAPTRDWVNNQVPDIIKNNLRDHGRLSETDPARPSQSDLRTILPCNIAILTGACLALGIRYAGTQDRAASETILSFLLPFLDASYTADVGRYTSETSLATLLVALSMVMAGSGDLRILQICRYLHTSVGAEISYGVQMMIHMALGFLFLGGCRRTLCTSDKAIAALLASVYPCFPFSSTDNQYHLQALRHFYVLATEQRLLVPVDSETKLPCYAKVNITYLGQSNDECSYKMMAPYMLPEFKYLKEVSVDDPRHWPITIDVQNQPEKLKKLLEVGMSVQRRTGYQLYIRDPQGHRSLLARSADFSKSDTNWNMLLSDAGVNCHTFATVYLNHDHSDSDDEDRQEAKRTSHMSSLLRNLVTHERTQTLYTFFGLQQMCRQMQRSCHPNPLAVWQLKLANDFLKRAPWGNDAIGTDNVTEGDMTSARFIGLLSAELQKHFEKILSGTKGTLQTLLGITPRSGQTSRPKRGAKRKDMSSDCATLTLPKPAWTSEVPAHVLWQMTCFSIYNSLPVSFLFPKTTDTSEKMAVTQFGEGTPDAEILTVLKSRNIGGFGAVQIFKALRT